jgi:hypothetical protein
MNDCGAKSKLSAPLIYLSKTGNYRYFMAPPAISLSNKSSLCSLVKKGMASLGIGQAGRFNT